MGYHIRFRSAHCSKGVHTRLPVLVLLIGKTWHLAVRKHIGLPLLLVRVDGGHKYPVEPGARENVVNRDEIAFAEESRRLFNVER